MFDAFVQSCLAGAALSLLFRFRSRKVQVVTLCSGASAEEIKACFDEHGYILIKGFFSQERIKETKRSTGTAYFLCELCFVIRQETQ